MAQGIIYWAESLLFIPIGMGYVSVILKIEIISLGLFSNARSNVHRVVFHRTKERWPFPNLVSEI